MAKSYWFRTVCLLTGPSISFSFSSIPIAVIFRRMPTVPLTFHGLRHTYAAEKYRKLIDGGMGSLDAHFAVSRLLGHERADVTDIYLASLPKEGRHGK